LISTTSGVDLFLFPCCRVDRALNNGKDLLNN
jgi:hypothetical protein